VVLFWVGCLNCSLAEASSPLDKLGRGVTNIATGWLELPFGIARTTEREGSLAGVSVGVLRGVAYGLGRTAIGFFETVTFLFPNHMGEKVLPPQRYGPIVDPPFIIFRSADQQL